MGISALTTYVNTVFGWNAQQAGTGGIATPVINTNQIGKSVQTVATLGNAVAGGADEVFSFQIAITAGGSATLDLNAMTNVLNTATVALARIKTYQLRLLSASDDSTISPAPNAASTVTVSNNGLTLPTPLDFGTGGSGLTITITVSAGAIATVAIGAAGTGYPKSSTQIVNVIQSTGSGGLASVTVNSSGVPTAVALVAPGTGYTAATLPTNVVGQYTLTTGDTHLMADVTGAGFCPVSATLKNLKIYNNDTVNAVTVEFDAVGATS